MVIAAKEYFQIKETGETLKKQGRNNAVINNLQANVELLVYKHTVRMMGCHII